MTHILDALSKPLLKLRRKRLSNRIFADAGGVVQRGAFAGLKLDGRSNVSRSCLGQKVLGIYEAAVFEEIELRGRFGDAVCVGAADGFYALGLVKSGLAKRAICFEITANGREAIVRNAVVNGVSEQVVVLGKADETFGQQLKAHDFVTLNALVICDIEGAEFSVLSGEVLSALDGAVLIVELHDKILKDAALLRGALIGRLPHRYEHKIVREKPIDWRGIAALENLSDNDRGLAASEGRKIIGEWLIAAPKK